MRGRLRSQGFRWSCPSFSERTEESCRAAFRRETDPPPPGFSRARHHYAVPAFRQPGRLLAQTRHRSFSLPLSNLLFKQPQEGGEGHGIAKADQVRKAQFFPTPRPSPHAGTPDIPSYLIMPNPAFNASNRQENARAAQDCPLGPPEIRSSRRKCQEWVGRKRMPTFSLPFPAPLR